MQKKIVFMFAGQGAQYYHMGRELYQNQPMFKYWMDHCDEITRPMLQESLLDIVYANPIDKSEPFNQIQYTNPALISIEYSLAKVVMDLGIQPDYVMGYSLGEITASVVSGVTTLEKALNFSIDLAKLVHSGTEAAGMLGIIGSVDLLEHFPEMFNSCWLTGKNFNNHFVISGRDEDIQKLKKNLSKKNIIFQELPVNYGFHTPLMDPIEQELKLCTERLNQAMPKIPIISCSNENTLDVIDRNHLWEVIRKPVNFEASINSMLVKEDCIFIDVGPSGSLSTAVKYILPPESKSRHLEVINQFGKDLKSYEKLKESLMY